MSHRKWKTHTDRGAHLNPAAVVQTSVGVWTKACHDGKLQAAMTAVMTAALHVGVNKPIWSNEETGGGRQKKAGREEDWARLQHQALSGKTKFPELLYLPQITGNEQGLNNSLPPSSASRFCVLQETWESVFISGDNVLTLLCLNPLTHILRLPKLFN